MSQRTFLAGMKEVPTGHEDLFWQMDKDRSGYLSVDELAELLKTNGYNLTKAEVKAKFAGMDTDKDGKVSYDEYLKAMGAMETTVHRQAFYRRKFQRYDINKDGAITIDELQQVFKDIGASDSVEFAKEVFKKCDKDGTGKIEYEEFIKNFCME